MELLKQRFWKKVDKNGPVSAWRPDLGPCWLWTGALQGNGYGTFDAGYRQTTAHRFSYEWENGPMPAGLQPDHLCRVRRCVRPSHLEAVTCRENLLRGNTHASRNAKKTHCAHGHPYNGRNLKLNAKGRACRACDVAYTQASRLKTKLNAAATENPDYRTGHRIRGS